jgi:hypothetical protein
MVRPRPYLFCRYSFFVDEERLGARGQLTALQEIQGQLFAHGPKAEREGRHDTVVMRPRLIVTEREEVLVWSIGQKVDIRIAAVYDTQADRLELIARNDGSVRYNDFVAIPRLGVLAVDDRSGERHITGKTAISRLRSCFRNLEGGEVRIEWTTTSEDVDIALGRWDLQEVTYKVRPVNPHARDVLSKQLSDAMEREGIGTLRAVMQPRQGSQMRPNEGLIDQGRALSEEGYGQIGVKGYMDRHLATIKRPIFEEDRNKNERHQERPRELRVQIETEGDTDDESFERAAAALVDFYDRTTYKA